jgi:2'-5' RNA ligase
MSNNIIKGGHAIMLHVTWAGKPGYPDEQGHLTLGHFGRDKASSYGQHLLRVADEIFAPRSLRVTGLGMFGPQHNVLALTVASSEELLEARKQMEDAAKVEDIAFDTKYKFTPHVTLRDSVSQLRVPEMLTVAGIDVKLGSHVLVRV